MAEGRAVRIWLMQQKGHVSNHKLERERREACAIEPGCMGCAGRTRSSGCVRAAGGRCWRADLRDATVKHGLVSGSDSAAAAVASMR